MTYFLAFISSKFARWLAFAGAVLTGLAIYGARREKQGQASLRQEIQDQKEVQREKLDEIRHNTPLSGNVDRLLRDAEARSNDKSAGK
jgi:hypothetical protein